MSKILFLDGIREALQKQSPEQKRLSRKQRVNRVIGAFAQLRDENGRRLFWVQTDADSRKGIMESLTREDFQ